MKTNYLTVIKGGSLYESRIAQSNARRWLPLPYITYFKIYAGEELYGGIAYFHKEPHKYYLARMYIKPSSQCHGIGSAAILEAEKYFADASLYSLDFPIDQVKNKTCYEKAGYCDTGRRDVVNDRLLE